MFKKLTRNPFFFFLPLLCYYGYLIVQHHQPGQHGDEVRYIDYADHLMHGFYSPPLPYISLWNGPGYPIMLLPFAFLHTNPLYQTLMNAPYLYLAVVFLYKSLRLVSNSKIALVLSLLYAMYPNALAMLPMLYTEAFTNLLVALFVYTAGLCYVKGKNNYAMVAGLILGFLVLTKIIFGYVLVIGAGIFLAALLIKKHKTLYIKAIKILLIAFAVTMPYLGYTWHLTGKLFYWGNSGGMSLYWMSTPYEQEYGDWKVPDLSNRQYPTMFKSTQADSLLKANHSKDIAFINRHKNNLVQDELYKQIAIKNIKEHPMKFAANYMNNLSRMLFNFPYSYSFQDAGVARSFIVGSALLWAVLISTVLTVVNWRRIHFAVKFLLLITTVYLFLSGMLSAYPRQLDIIVPVFIFWFGFLAQQLKKPKLRFDDDLDDISLAGLKSSGLYTEDGITRIDKL